MSQHDLFITLDTQGMYDSHRTVDSVIRRQMPSQTGSVIRSSHPHRCVCVLPNFPGLFARFAHAPIRERGDVRRRERKRDRGVEQQEQPNDVWGKQNLLGKWKTPTPNGKAPSSPGQNTAMPHFAETAMPIGRGVADKVTDRTMPWLVWTLRAVLAHLGMKSNSDKTRRGGAFR